MSTWSKYKGLHFQTYDRYFLFTDQSMVVSVGANEYADIAIQDFSPDGTPIEYDSWCHAVINFGGGNIGDMIYGGGSRNDAGPVLMGPGSSGTFTAPKSSVLASGLIILDVWRYAPNQIYDT